MKFFTFETGTLKIKSGDMFINIPSHQRHKLYHVDENGLCTLSIRTFLIQQDERIILIDTGVGDTIPADLLEQYKYTPSGSMLSHLTEVGFKERDITDVILTHLHFDHCGGSIKKKDSGKFSEDDYEPVFSKASFWISKIQWDWAQNNKMREHDSFIDHIFQPMAHSGRLHLVECKDMCELFPDVSVRMFNGHTKGLMIPFVRHNEGIIVFVGDLIPTSAHVPLSNSMTYDIDPDKSYREKLRFLHDAEKEKYILFFQHDLYHDCAKVVLTKNGFSTTEASVSYSK
jgi:glyoxylase-like metal-dependent hydrolase (beta-lactamase superfamily II)